MPACRLSYAKRSRTREKAQNQRKQNRQIADLKSANVMLASSGDVKVVDFGWAKHTVGPEMTETVMHAPSSLTEPGTIGALAYMSPEQFRGESADARSDVWALGVMLDQARLVGEPSACRWLRWRRDQEGLQDPSARH